MITVILLSVLSHESPRMYPRRTPHPQRKSCSDGRSAQSRFAQSIALLGLWVYCTVKDWGDYKIFGVASSAGERKKIYGGV